jgi:hypothetical protein
MNGESIFIPAPGARDVRMMKGFLWFHAGFTLRDKRVKQKRKSVSARGMHRIRA